MAWKYKFMLMLEEHDLEGYIKDEVKEPEGDESKAKHKKDMIKTKRIMVDSTKDHLFPQVSLKSTPDEMFDALTSMFEGKNINIVRYNSRFNIIPLLMHSFIHYM